MTGALAAAAALVWADVEPQDTEFSPIAVVAALVLMFLVAETTQLHLEVRRQTYSVSLSELPLVVGLLLASPAMLLLARLGAYALVAGYRRMSPLKAAFNLALFTLEVGVAVWIMQRPQFLAADEARAWGLVYVAALATVLIGSLAVGAAIRMLQPPLGRREFVTMVVSTLVIALFTVTVGVGVVVLVEASLWTLLGLVVVAGVLVFAYRRYARLITEHKDLGELYELTREVSTALRGDTLDEVVLERVRSLMRAEVAQLWLSDSEIVVAKPADEPSTTSQSDPDDIRRRVLAGTGVLAGPKAREPAVRSALQARGVTEMVAVPLRIGGDVAGCLEVLDRQGERSTFGAADRSLLETLAVHTGVALENARLVGRLQHEAEHDELTGLPNRKAFVRRLEAAIDAAPPGTHLAVLVLDLQAFKDVNDTLGRAAGDRLLVEIATRVRDNAPDPATVARLSSDEIGTFTRVTDPADARAAAARVQGLLAEPVHLGAVEVTVGAVVGIALWPEHAGEADAVTLVQRADVAMYAAKGTSRGLLTFAPAMDAPSARRLGLVTDLRRALQAGDLRVFYQPQVRLDRSELVGMEALVRWQHAEQGFIPPDEFIPVAEHTGLIGTLTSYVLAQSLADLAEWRRRGHEFSMSVNMSVRSLLDPVFADEVAVALGTAGVPPELLTLEITESGVMSDPDRAMPVLERLRDMGVRLSVDDFGIGQSSLTYLRRLPVEEVKIDRSFVSSMVHTPGDAAIVRAVVSLAEPLGLSVVAEGVESEETREELTRLGCGVIQGYLLSRPLAREDMDRWLARRTVAEAPERGGRHRWLRVVSG